MLDSLLAIIAPHLCLGCGLEGELWCPDCRRAALPVAERCFRCHQLSPGGRTCRSCRRVSSLFAVRAVTRYEDIPKQLVWKLKFERARAGAAAVASLMTSRQPLPPDILITYVPTSTNHVRRRGYDQARLIASALARRTDSRCHTLLVRLGQQEQHTAGRAQRLTQLKQAFLPIRTDDIQGRHILLIDDVITTGATLDAAAQALKSAGAKRVSALVFAQA